MKYFAAFNLGKELVIRGRCLAAILLYEFWLKAFFSSPEPLGSQGELIGWPWSGVRPASDCRRPPFSKIFFSETAWPIKAKFYMKHLWEGGTNVFLNNTGHMTKMATISIYGKNPSKFFSGTTGPISKKIGMKHRGLEYYNVFINYDLWMT